MRPFEKPAQRRDSASDRTVLALASATTSMPDAIGSDGAPGLRQVSGEKSPVAYDHAHRHFLG
jgi:hypothetical protein